MALQVLEKCIETGPEDANPETSSNFYIQYNFELLDDTFSVWDKSSGLENEYFQGRNDCLWGRNEYFVAENEYEN